MAKINGFKLAAKAADAKSKTAILSQVYVSGGVATATDLDIEVIAPSDMPDGAYNVRGEPVAVPADRADYQSPNTPELAAQEEAPLGDFAAMLARVSPAMSTEETRYYLNGVFCEFKDGLKVTATDGHRMLHYSPENAPSFEIGEFILPRKTVAMICAIKGGDWTLKATETRVEFRDSVSGIVIRSKLIDGSFPDYRRVIPKGDFAEILTGNAKACLAVVDKLARYGRERSKSVKLCGTTLLMSPPEIAPLETTWPVSIAFGTAERTTRESDGQRVWVKYTPTESLEIGFNAGYVRDMLTIAAMDKGASVVLKLRDSASPARFEFPACPGLVGVQMPLRL